MKATIGSLVLVTTLVLFSGVTSATKLASATPNTGASLHAGLLSQPTATLLPGTPVRIHFAVGTIAATRTSHLGPLASDLFVVAARRGQTLETFVESPGALLFVWGPDGSELIPGAGQMPVWRATLPANGDYFIAVNSTGRATGYKLTVIVDTPEPAGAARIRFATGATSATMRGRIAAGSPSRYVLRALAGQTLMVSATAAQPGLLYSVAGVDGAVIMPFSAGPGAWRPELPATQDYTIVLVSPDAPASYTMTVSASPLQSVPTPQPSRIYFQPGATSATVSGQLAPGAARTRVLRASAGQIMQVGVSANVATTTKIWGADGSQLNRGWEEQGWQGALPKTQDYTIQVLAPRAQPASYCLRVTVYARIQFARRATSATVTSPVQTCVPQGTEVVGGYVLRAPAGQTMRVSVSSARLNVYLTIAGADGAPVKYYDDYLTTWEGKLPSTQDYQVLPVAVGGGSRFTIAVTIPASAQTAPTRIRFAPGATSATVSGSLPQGAPARYVLAAARGQRMEIRVWPAPAEYVPPRLNVAVTGPGGAVWSDLGLDAAIDPLPASGDYVITLALQPGSPGTNYLMEVTIPAQ